MKLISSATLLIFLFSFNTKAQVDAKLHVGDPAPAFKPYQWLKGSPVTTFSKDKVYVLEFGATWCKPCIALIPHLSELQEKYKDQIEVISVFVMEPNDQPLNTPNPKYVEIVKRFIEKRSATIKYTVAVDDPAKTIERNYIRAAGRQGIPHTFIVDKEGKISAITSSFTETEVAVRKALSKEYNITARAAEQAKIDAAAVKYNANLPLLINHNGGEDNDFVFRSLLTVFKGEPKNPPIYYVAASHETGLLQTTGTSLPELFMLAYMDTLWSQVYPRSNSTHEWPDTVKFPGMKLAYGKYWYEPILEVKDKEPFQWNYRSPDHKFNYSLHVPPEKASARFLQSAMQRDLKNYFGYEVRVEERLMPCWKVVLLPDAEKKLVSVTPGQPYTRTQQIDGTITLSNVDMRDIIFYLGSFYGFGMLDYHKLPPEEIAPFVDATGFKGTFDTKYQSSFRDSFEGYRQYLNTIGLDVVKSSKKTKVIIIADPKE